MIEANADHKSTAFSVRFFLFFKQFFQKAGQLFYRLIS